ncbi:MAG: XRE family transcriptional regulator [Actinomycetota bacterium]|nr:XRE family transcriptional regulator [Actinomycetota bacterium]
MTPNDSVAIGLRIAEARSRADLTQTALAAQVSIDRSALAKIESGTRRVSALELARIASAVGERIEWFVLDTPAAILSHRNVTEPGAASPEIDKQVERVAWSVKFVTEHDERLALAPQPPREKPRTASETEVTAASARQLIGLDASEPCVDLSRRFAELGLLLFVFDLSRDTADAASLRLEHGGVAVVNGNLQVGRRRLAAMHEFGHYLFADEYVTDWKVGESDDESAWEGRLDRFARAVLLPSAGVEQVWSTLRSEGDDLRAASVKVASRFRVDMSTLARRLTELGLISHGEAHLTRQTRTTRADIVDFNLVVPHELESPHLPRVYEEAVLRLYRQETVSAARATDLLFDTWDEDELPKLPDLPESAVWNLV